jgi:hypothetical protein
MLLLLQLLVFLAIAVRPNNALLGRRLSVHLPGVTPHSYEEGEDVSSYPPFTSRPCYQNPLSITTLTDISSS